MSYFLMPDFIYSYHSILYYHSCIFYHSVIAEKEALQPIMPVLASSEQHS